MKKLLYPGSFDPVTFGHLDVIRRGAALCDRLYVAVLINSEKSPFFSVDERVDILREAVKDIPNVEVCSFSGLTVDFASQLGCQAMLRGLRAVTDFEYELQISQINRKLSPEIDTVFLTTSLKYAYLSSSIVKEIASYNGDISEFVPQFVADRIHEKLRKRGSQNE